MKARFFGIEIEGTPEDMARLVRLVEDPLDSDVFQPEREQAFGKSASKQAWQHNNIYYGSYTTWVGATSTAGNILTSGGGGGNDVTHASYGAPNGSTRTISNNQWEVKYDGKAQFP